MATRDDGSSSAARVCPAICTLEKFGPDATAVLREPLVDSFTAGNGLDVGQRAQLDQWLDLWEFFGRAAHLRNST